METVKGFLDSFKEFIWDIIGYFLPGFYLIILTSACISPRFSLSTEADRFGDMRSLVVVVIAYLLGFVVYGVSLFKEEMLGRKSYRRKIEAQFEKNTTFLIVKATVERKINEKTGETKPLEIRELRNIVMSNDPASDQKIYTFMFRSELSSHVANVSLIFGVIGLINFLIVSIFNCDNLILLNLTLPHILLYVFLLLAYFLLAFTRDRFYGIAIRLPFSLYLAKQLS